MNIAGIYLSLVPIEVQTFDIMLPIDTDSVVLFGRRRAGATIGYFYSSSADMVTGRKFNYS